MEVLRYSRHHQTVLFERRPPHEHSDIKKQAKIPLTEGRKSGLLARRYGSLRRIFACRNAKNPLKQRVSWSEPRGIRRGTLVRAKNPQLIRFSAFLMSFFHSFCAVLFYPIRCRITLLSRIIYTPQA